MSTLAIGKEKNLTASTSLVIYFKAYRFVKSNYQKPVSGTYILYIKDIMSL